MEGTMLWFNPAKRHGFVLADSGERLPIDEDGLRDKGSLGDGCRGTRVRFDLVSGELEEGRAVNVSALPLFAARRARMRRAGR